MSVRKNVTRNFHLVQKAHTEWAEFIIQILGRLKSFEFLFYFYLFLIFSPFSQNSFLQSRQMNFKNFRYIHFELFTESSMLKCVRKLNLSKTLEYLIKFHCLKYFHWKDFQAFHRRMTVMLWRRMDISQKSS